MSAHLYLLRYHFRLGIGWAALVPPLGLAALLAGLSAFAAPAERAHNLGVGLGTCLPLLAALLAAPLLLAEREQGTLVWLATRRSLGGVLAARLALLGVYLLLLTGATILIAALLWRGPWSWSALPYVAVPALAFAALSSLAAAVGRSSVHGYICAVALWLGALVLIGVLPASDVWRPLEPFAWSFGFSRSVVAHSALLYSAIGALLLLAQWRILRHPERLLGPGA